MVAPQFPFAGKEDSIAEMPRGRIVTFTKLCIKHGTWHCPHGMLYSCLAQLDARYRAPNTCREPVCFVICACTVQNYDISW